MSTITITEDDKGMLISGNLLIGPNIYIRGTTALKPPIQSYPLSVDNDLLTVDITGYTVDNEFGPYTPPS